MQDLDDQMQNIELLETGEWSGLEGILRTQEGKKFLTFAKLYNKGLADDYEAIDQFCAQVEREEEEHALSNMKSKEYADYLKLKAKYEPK